MGIKSRFYNAVKKPSGMMGRAVLKRMNGGVHAELADWGMSFLGDINPSGIMDIGCGGGRNVSEFLRRFPGAHVTGFDYSAQSVRTARRYNREEVKAGRCDIVQGNVRELPFEEGSFDLISAFETIYFWPEIGESFKQVARVLKTGGRFMIVNESDGHDKESEGWADIIDGLNRYTKEQVEELLKGAGFENISIQHDTDKHWLCIIGIK